MSKLPLSFASSTTELCSKADLRGVSRLSIHARRRQATEDRIEQRQDQSVRIRFHDGAMRADAAVGRKF